MATDEPVVPQFCELVVPGGQAKLDELVDQIDNRLEAPWSRDHETEESPQLDGDYRVFGRAESKAGPGLLLFVIARGDDVEIANVVPTGERYELTMREYNDAVTEFSSRFLAQSASVLGFEVIISPTELSMSEVLDEPTFRDLLTFSRTSNRATGSSHPSDREKWYSFIIGVHRSQAGILPEDLETWLILDGWSEDIAFDLIHEFEFATGLLSYADGH